MKFVCSKCGEEHDGLPALGLNSPDYWRSLHDDIRAKGYCGEDTCFTREGQFFIKGILAIPVRHSEHNSLEYGAWVSFDEETYLSYEDLFDDPRRMTLDRLFGSLANEFVSFPASLGLHCQLRPREPGTRPWILLSESNHELSVAQRTGIAQEIVHETL